MSERQAKDFIKRAVAIYGSGIIPKAIRGDLELQGMLEFMGTNNESYYYNKLAKRITGLSTGKVDE